MMNDEESVQAQTGVSLNIISSFIIKIQNSSFPSARGTRVSKHVFAAWRSSIRTSFAVTIRLIALLAFVSAFAQEPAQTIHGTWIATAGRGQTLHGSWTGSALPRHPDTAQGTWALANGGRIVLQGTWRAEKSRQGWEGHWTARTSRGESMAGSWGADVEHWKGKSFQELLELTLQEEVSGWWQVGPRQGNWWLKGSRHPAR